MGTKFNVFTGNIDFTGDSGAVTASDVTNAPTGNLAGATVQAALNELQGDIDTINSSTALSDHISDTTDAHDASAISNVAAGNLAATDVQAALNELQSDIDGRASTTLSNLGTTDINSDLIFNKANATVKTKDSAAATTSTILLKTGDGTGFGSGDANIITGTSTTTNTGNIYISSGDKTGSQTGASGAVTIISGEYSSSSNSKSGDVVVRSGDKSGSGSAATGDVTVRTGAATTANGPSGLLTLQSGDQTGTGTATSGTVTVKSGNVSGGIKTSGTTTITTGNSSGGSTGALFLKSGDAATGFASGAIVLQSGAVTGTRGKIKFVDGTEGTTGHAWVSSSTDGTGSWSANIRLPNGSISAPSYSFSGSTNTGMYLAGSSLAFAHEGVGYLEINSNILRPITTNNVALGGTTRRFSGVYSETKNLVDSSNTEYAALLKTTTTTSVASTASLVAYTTPVALFTSNKNSASTNSANVYIESGNATGTTSNSGDIKLQTGTATGTRGNITIDAPKIVVPATITTGGTTGNQTIDKISGTVNFAAAATSLVVTNNTVTANSIVLAVIRTNDATMTSVQVVPAAGSFTIYANAAATAETSVGFFVVS